MKFSKLSQLFLVSSIGLLVATLLTACQLVTIDYVFVSSSAGTANQRRWADRNLCGGLASRALCARELQRFPAGGVDSGSHGSFAGLHEPLRRQQR